MTLIIIIITVVSAFVEAIVFNMGYFWMIFDVNFLLALFNFLFRLFTKWYKIESIDSTIDINKNNDIINLKNIEQKEEIKENFEEKIEKEIQKEFEKEFEKDLKKNLKEKLNKQEDIFVINNKTRFLNEVEDEYSKILDQDPNYTEKEHELLNEEQNKNLLSEMAWNKPVANSAKIIDSGNEQNKKDFIDNFFEKKKKKK